MQRILMGITFSYVLARTSRTLGLEIVMVNIDVTS